ncbi:MAG: acyltransferase [Kiritimatiellae bacterium]|nr:acyltransferase [Kiritimatiellia bacterium]
MSLQSDPIPEQIQQVMHGSGEPAWKQYARLTVGAPSLGRLLKYECITGLFSAWPGAAGLALRRMAYRSLLGGMGRGVTIGRNVTLRGAARIRLGRQVALDDQVVLDARGPDASIEIGDGTLISRNTIIRARNGRIVIGEGSDIGANCILATNSRLEIGRDVLVAAFCYVTAGGHHKYDDPNTPIIRQGFISKGGVVIQDDVWLGSHTIVLDGVQIGHGVVVGAHSLVNRNLDPMSIAWGIPARPRSVRGQPNPTH